jgi:hypothetical protein
VEAQLSDEGSMLNLYRTGLRLRREHPALGDGDMTWLDSGPDELAFFRDPGFGFLANFGRKSISLPSDCRIILSSGPSITLCFPVTPQFGSKNRADSFTSRSYMVWTSQRPSGRPSETSQSQHTLGRCPGADWFNELEAARRSNELNVHVFGIGLDPLAWKTGIPLRSVQRG